MRRVWLQVWFVLPLAALAVFPGRTAVGDSLGAIPLTLSDTCPAGFAPDESGGCRLVTLYREYPSLQDQGMGGLKIGLPRIRDGFTPREIDLGRYLFFDPVLSADGDMSCATCHQPDKGFSDGRARGRGADGLELPRSTPSLWNVGLQRRFNWDARADSLEEQMEGPLFDPTEMANTPQQLLETLNGSPEYRRLFAEAYSRPAGEDITLEDVKRSIAAFQSTLVSLNSRYDYYAHGVHEALTAKEIEGMNVFRSFVARCAECHTPPLFTNEEVAVIGTPEPEGHPFDPGREAVTGDRSQRGGFKVPSLRNASLTAPYMHSGRFESLRETVGFYTGGRGHAVPDGEDLYLHWHIWEPQLTATELDRLVDFLGALEDQSFMPRTPDRVPSGLPLAHDTSGTIIEEKRP
jgi:cytochrome c peroxidase